MANIVAFDDSAVGLAADTLSRGALVAIPTETVYGLAADAENGAAVAEIFAAKGRPHFNPLIAHMSGVAMAQEYVSFDPLSRQLAETFWPGPLTLVLPLKDNAAIHPLVTAGLETLAVRMPKSRITEVISKLGRPLAAPSANRSGKISPTSAASVAAELGERIALILDGGPCGVGLESTIVKVVGEDVFLLRPGGLAAEDIEHALGRSLTRLDQRAAIQAPGMMQSHYAPEAMMRLGADHVDAGEALLAFGPVRAGGSDAAKAVLNLSPSGDLAEAAANLFDFMKRLDATGATRIAVEPIPHVGLGEAINDRLRRAAAPRA